MLQRAFTVLLTLLVVGAVSFSTPTLAAESSKVFELHCAGCHLNGGNIVRRGKNLKLKTLEKHQMATLEAIATLVTNGKGNMSAYGDRLTPEEIRQVSSYVLEQAQQGWR